MEEEETEVVEEEEAKPEGIYALEVDFVRKK